MIIDDLKDFYKKLKSYNRYVCSEEQLSQVQIGYRDSLREKLVRQSGALKGKIIELTGKQYVEGPLTGRFDIWAEAFNTIAMSADRTALAFCIQNTNEAIGKIESDIEKGIRDNQGNGIEKPEKIFKDVAELPSSLFDKMQFHPKISHASKSLYENKHYAQAIFEAFKAVENFVQDKSDLNLYGTNLMETVFNEENPIIKVPEAGHYYKDVQRGFKHLFIGAAQAIRNPKAHKEIIQKDPYITLEYLGFASFLLKRIDYWEADIS